MAVYRLSYHPRLKSRPETTSLTENIAASWDVIYCSIVTKTKIIECAPLEAARYTQNCVLSCADSLPFINQIFPPLKENIPAISVIK